MILPCFFSASSMKKKTKRGLPPCLSANLAACAARRADISQERRLATAQVEIREHCPIVGPAQQLAIWKEELHSLQWCANELAYLHAQTSYELATRIHRETSELGPSNTIASETKAFPFLTMDD
mmetsp:Transcript_104170/g.196075  ORF Transcript_104170/g.196075 Transcript_104170/m.196075 type:complete len:124 (+) Transcript_104170:1-372(+)